MNSERLNGGTLYNLSPDEVAAAMARGEIVLIDVRTPQEYALERIGGAMLFPMQDFDPAHLPRGDAQRIVLHCGSGKRSRAVAETCLKAGAPRIAHLAGGFVAWKQDGQPYIGTDPSSGAPKRMRQD